MQESLLKVVKSEHIIKKSTCNILQQHTLQRDRRESCLVDWFSSSVGKVVLEAVRGTSGRKIRSIQFKSSNLPQHSQCLCVLLIFGVHDG